MKFEKEYGADETAAILNKFISRYVDKNKLFERILLCNSIKDEIEFERRPFSQIMSLAFFEGKTLFLYDEREKVLRQTKWTEILGFISQLEPWEENIDFLLFDEGFEWFAAITHEDLSTICAGKLLSENRHQERNGGKNEQNMVERSGCLSDLSPQFYG